MKDDSGLENLFEEDKESSDKTKESISGSLTLAGNIFLWIGWFGVFMSAFLTMATESLFPLLSGVVILFSCYISSLIFKGLSKIIDLLEDIKNK